MYHTLHFVHNISCCINTCMITERGFYANGYMTLIETKDLLKYLVCFMDVWIAFLMESVCRVCVCMLVSV